MRLKFKRPPEMNTIGRKIQRDIKTALSIRVGVALTEFHRFLNETPVYTGKTLINYQWSLGEAVTDVRSAIKVPDLPGKTSVMAIGEEPRREANQAVIDSEFRRVLAGYQANPFQKVFLRNNVPNFEDIEYGAYGVGARTPAGGMTRRGESALRVIVRGVTKSG